MTRITYLLLFLSLLPAAGAARERIALVIGNADYRVAPLDNPLNDARDMAAALRSAGFRVILKTDADQAGMESAVAEFSRALNSDSEGLFYYSGHGVQHEGENYLIPVNAIPDILVAEHLRYKAVHAGYILGVMKAAGSPLNIVVLDACRDNPFRGFGKSLVRGLAQMPAAEGTLIAYATAPGKQAIDGLGGRNSPYTESLLRFMRQPGLSLDRVLKNTGRAVKKATGGKQTPWYSSSIYGDFWFVKGAPPPPETVRLTVRSNQYHDETRIDGKSYGATPVTVELTKGRHQVRVTKKGFQAYEQWLELEKDTLVKAQLVADNSVPLPPAESSTVNPPRTGSAFVEPKSGIKFIKIPGGCAGSVCAHQGGHFWIAATEVTQAQWQKLMGNNPSRFKGGNRPVESISWHEAHEFTAKLGKGYRLPTEQEWEYAARAGSSGEYSRDQNGREVTEGNLDRYAWYSKNAGGETHAVKGKEPNRFGLYDMHGNVWEWTCSAWETGENSRDGCISNNHANGDRVIRGGAWFDAPRLVRSAVRSLWSPGYRFDFLGFRPARIE